MPSSSIASREFATSLRLRSMAMSWALGGALLAAVTMSLLLPQFGLQLLPAELPMWAPITVILLLLVLEVGVVSALGRAATRVAAGPGMRAIEMGVGVAEVSAVSVFLAVASQYLDPPIGILFSPGTWLYFPLIGVATLTLRPAVVAVTGALASAQYGILSWWIVRMPENAEAGIDALFTNPAMHIEKAVVMLATTGIGAAVCWDLRRRMKGIVGAVREREEIVDLFGQQTAPQVVEAYLTSGGRLVPERREVGLLFLDIRGFTGEAERSAPERVVARLDDFFERVIPTITTNGGIVHQLLGDGLMAIFGAPVAHPDDARRALDTAIDIVEQLEAAVEAGEIQATEVAMGVHFGEVVAGPVGSRDHKEYKVTGDAVNVASRLESIAKERGARILCSRRAVEAAGYEVEDFEDLGCVRVRGRRAELGVVRVR